MNIKLIKEAEAPLLSRRRLSFEVDYPGSKTPSKDVIKKAISTLQKVKEELVAVRHIYPKFGECKAKIIVHLYNNLKDLQRHEPKKKIAKSESAPAEKKEEQHGGKVDAKKESKEQKAE